MIIVIKNGIVISNYPDGTQLSSSSADIIHVPNHMAGLFALMETDPRDDLTDEQYNDIVTYNAQRSLCELDQYIDRATEDLIESGAIPETALSAHNRARLARKRALRAVISGDANG